MIKLSFVILSLVVFGVLGTTAYAQPLEEISVSVLESTSSEASVGLEWNFDGAVSNYEIGCVSCIPNMSENTINNTIVLDNITALDNGIVLLYVIAYDQNNEIIAAKQVITNLDS